jgi:glycosyltransferase involved in cell wall biosynthesis
MKIAHVVSTYPPYYAGMGNVVYETVRILRDLGHEVVVFTPDYGESITSTSDIVGEVERLKPSMQYGNAARLTQLEERLNYFDIVHLHYPFFGTAGIVRRWKQKNPDKKLVVTYHMDTHSPGWKGLVFLLYAKFFFPRLVDSADIVIASSIDYVENGQIADVYENTKDKWFDLPFGVDADRFCPREKRVDILERHHLDPTIRTVLFVGGMDDAHYFKGVEILIRAIFLHNDSGGRCVQAILVGDGNLRPLFERLTVDLGVGDRVVFVGRVSGDELPAYYNATDVLVLPSVSMGEAFGTVLLEAMASGLPVIASDLPGVRIVAGVGGVVVPMNDTVALASAIEDVLSIEKYDSLSKSARIAVFDKYNWRSVIEELEGYYLGLLD